MQNENLPNLLELQNYFHFFKNTILKLQDEKMF